MYTKVLRYKSFLYIANFSKSIAHTCLYAQICCDRESKWWKYWNNSLIDGAPAGKSRIAMAQSLGKKKRSAWREPQIISKERTVSLGGGAGDFAWGNPGDTNESFQPNRVGESARDELFSPVSHDEADGFAEDRRSSGYARGDCDYSSVRLSAHCRMPRTIVPYDGTAACRHAAHNYARNDYL